MFLDTILDPIAIFEANSDEYGRKFYFDYTKMRHRSPDRHPIRTKPVVFYLGKWPRKLKSGETRNYWCGVALNHLDEEQLAALKTHASEILKKRRLYDRYWAGRRLLPDIFQRFYRTYRADRIENVIKGRLFTLKVTDADTAEAKVLAQNDGADFDKLSDQEQGQYIEKAIVQRGEADLKAQGEAAKEREEEEMPAQPPEPVPVAPQQEPTLTPVEPEPTEIMPRPAPPKPSKFRPISRAPVPPPAAPPAPQTPPPAPPTSIRGSKHGMVQPPPDRTEQKPRSEPGIE